MKFASSYCSPFAFSPLSLESNKCYEYMSSSLLVYGIGGLTGGGFTGVV